MQRLADSFVSSPHYAGKTTSDNSASTTHIISSNLFKISVQYKSMDTM